LFSSLINLQYFSQLWKTCKEVIGAGVKMGPVASLSHTQIKTNTVVTTLLHHDARRVQLIWNGNRAKMFWSECKYNQFQYQCVL